MKRDLEKLIKRRFIKKSHDFAQRDGFSLSEVNPVDVPHYAGCIMWNFLHGRHDFLSMELFFTFLAHEKLKRNFTLIQIKILELFLKHVLVVKENARWDYSYIVVALVALRSEIKT